MYNLNVLKLPKNKQEFPLHPGPRDHLSPGCAG